MAGLEMHELGRVENAGGASGGASSSTVSRGGTASNSDDVALDTETLLAKVEQQHQLLQAEQQHQLLQAEQQRPQMETTPARDVFLIISRVREPTRNVRPDEYTPHYVPIGPYHSSTSSQRRIDEDEKSKYLAIFLNAFSRRTGENDRKVLLRKLLQEMKNLDASSCYSDRFDGMGAENEFLHMLLLDGCYLLACFADSLYRRSSLSPNNNGEPQQEEEDGLPTTGVPAARTESAGAIRGSRDGVPTTSAATSTRILTASSIMASNNGAADVPQVDGLPAPAARIESASANDGAVRETMYLLENQIPFFVVKKIHELVTGETPSTVLTEFAKYVKKLLHDQLYISERPEGPPPSDPSHLLHLVRTYFTLMEHSSAVQAEGGDAASSGMGRWHRATQYCSYANVRFRRQKLDNLKASSVLDVNLEVRLAGATLLVPLLRVDNNTWTILRNLMALEEHHAGSLPRHVTAYCFFMSQLACTEEDVALLVRGRVVQHFLGSDAEVAAGFADLCKGVFLDVDDLNSNYLTPVWHELERRYRSRWHNLLALFQQTHGRNLWYRAAFAATVILFAMQVLQGICSIIGLKKK